MTKAKFPKSISEGSATVMVYETIAKSGYRSYQLVWYAEGRRQRRTLSDPAKAEKEAYKIVGDLAEGRHAATGLSFDEIEEYRVCRKKLAGSKLSLLEVVTEYLRTWDKKQRRTTVQKLSEEYQALCATKSEAYKRDLRFRLTAFCADFGNRQIDEITTDELRRWIDARKFKRGNEWLPVKAPKTKQNWKVMLGTLWQYAIETHAAKTNPTQSLSYEGDMAAHSLLFAEDLRKLLNELHLLGFNETREAKPVPQIKDPYRYSTTLLPYAAILAFAGVRVEEAKRLHWEDIKVEYGIPSTIEIAADAAKKSERRSVKIHPTLVTYLYPFVVPDESRKADPRSNRLKTGPIVPFRKADAIVRRIAKSIGIKWTHNCLRHSCATHMYRLVGTSEIVAEQLGTSREMLKQNYFERSTEAEAVKWFSIEAPYDLYMNIPGNHEMKANKTDAMIERLAKLKAGWLGPGA